MFRVGLVKLLTVLSVLSVNSKLVPVHGSIFDIPEWNKNACIPGAGTAPTLSDFYMKQMESDASEDDILINLAMMQYQSFEESIHIGNMVSWDTEQRKSLQKRIRNLVEKRRRRFFRSDEYSATLLMIFLDDFDLAITDDRDASKDRAQSIAYYLTHLLQEKEGKVRLKRSPSADQDSKKRISNNLNPHEEKNVLDLAYYYQLYMLVEKALKEIKDKKSRWSVESFIRFAGELLYPKTTDRNQKNLNDRVVKNMQSKIGTGSFPEFRDRYTHGQFYREIKLSGDIRSAYERYILPSIRNICLQEMAKLNSKEGLNKLTEQQRKLLTSINKVLENEKETEIVENCVDSHVIDKELGLFVMKRRDDDKRDLTKEVMAKIKQQRTLVSSKIEQAVELMVTNMIGGGLTISEIGNGLENVGITDSKNELRDFIKNSFAEILERRKKEYLKLITVDLRGEPLPAEIFLPFHDLLSKEDQLKETQTKRGDKDYYDEFRNKVSHTDISVNQLVDEFVAQKLKILAKFKSEIVRLGESIQKSHLQELVKSLQESKGGKKGGKKGGRTKNAEKDDTEEIRMAFMDIFSQFRYCEPQSARANRIKASALQHFSGKGCFEIEEAKKFATVDENSEITSIDSEKLLSTIEVARNVGDSETVHRLVDLTNTCEVTGKDKFAVARISEVHRQYSHLQKIGRIAGHINGGLMVEDFVSDLIAGDFEDAAISVGFLSASHGLAKVAGAALSKGFALCSVGKLVIGRILMIAAPFISRIPLLMVVWDLFEQEKEYDKGNKDAIVPIIGDAIQLGAEFISLCVETSEIFGLISGVSAVLGPVTQIIGLVVFTTVKIYSAVKIIQRVDEKIHLTGMEEFEEGLRVFLGLQLGEKIKSLLQEKESNDQVVVEMVNFLKNNPQIKRAIFPNYSTQSSTTFNYVLLDNKLDTNELEWKRTAPGDPAEGKIYFTIEDEMNNSCGLKWFKRGQNDMIVGKLFCAPSPKDEPGIPPTEKTYRADAIGIKYNKDREGKMAYINLADGNYGIIGFHNKPNIFVIGSGIKNIRGGDSNDLFKFIADTSVKNGSIDGLGGNDTVDISYLESGSYSNNMYFQEGRLFDEDKTIDFKVKNINKFIGRRGRADIVATTCDTMHVDTRGGFGGFGGVGEFGEFGGHFRFFSRQDIITIPNGVASIGDINYDVCNYDVKVIIWPDTVVKSKAESGTVTYIVSEEIVGLAVVDIDSTPKVNHQFIFAKYESSQISSIRREKFSITFIIQHHFKLSVTGATSGSSYQFSDGLKIIVGNSNMYALHKNHQRIDDYFVQVYSNFAINFKMNVIVHFPFNEVLSVGHDHHDVMQNDPDALISHLIGNGGHNHFSLIAHEGRATYVYIYNLENTRYTLDLREINKKFKFDDLVSNLQQFGKDLEIDLSTKNSYLIISIILKDAIINPWYRGLDVLVNGVLMIERAGEEFKLSPKPLIFNDKFKTEYVITPNDVEKGNSIEILRSIGNYALARDENTLIITNSLQPGSDRHCTVLLANFYTDDKMKTLDIKFNDKRIVLSNESTSISDKEDFHKRTEKFRADNYNLVMDSRTIKRSLQRNEDKGALELTLKLDYNLHEVRFNIDEPMRKEELIVDNLLGAIRNGDKEWPINHDMNIIGEDGESLVHIAALKGYLDVIKYLISMNADIHAKDNNGMTVMHYAASKGRIKIIKYLIDIGVEIDTRSKEGKTPLQSAASAGHLLAMRYLISLGADVNVTNRDQVTTLHYGSEGNSVDVIKYLLKRGFEINALTHLKRTPIYYAALKGSLEVMKYLVEHGADVASRASLGNTVLHYAAKRGDVGIVSYLLNQGIDIDSQNQLGNTPLHSASFEGNLSVVRYLIGNGADINIKNSNGEKAEDIMRRKGLFCDNEFNSRIVGHVGYDDLDELVENLFNSIIRKDSSLFVDRKDIFKIRDQSGRTLLHAVASKGYIPVARYLVEGVGAQVDAVDYIDRTPLYSAIFNNMVQVVKYLVGECGADIHHKDKNRRSPLHFAVLHDRVLIVKYLIQQGADVDAADDKKMTPLHLALMNDKEELAKYLILDGKSDVNAVDVYGNTPIHYSSMKGNLNIIQFLVDNGAGIFGKNVEAKTPLDMLRENGYEVTEIIRQFQLNATMIDAVKRNDIDKVRELVDAGADTSIRDKLGRTLIDNAVLYNYVNMARYLTNH